MKPPTLIAWENGPTGGASSGEIIAVLLMENSCGYWVRRASHDAYIFPQKHVPPDILMHDRKFHYFIIVTIIMPLTHDSAIRRENGLGDPHARRFTRPR